MKPEDIPLLDRLVKIGLITKEYDEEFDDHFVGMTSKGLEHVMIPVV